MGDYCHPGAGGAVAPAGTAAEPGDRHRIGAGGGGCLFGLRQALGALPYALAFAAAGFLYIAVAGLIPGLHRRVDARTSATQVILIAMGVAIIAGVERLAHQ